MSLLHLAADLLFAGLVELQLFAELLPQVGVVCLGENGAGGIGSHNGVLVELVQYVLFL